MTEFKFGAVKIEPSAFGSQGSAVLGIRDSGKTYTGGVYGIGWHCWQHPARDGNDLHLALAELEEERDEHRLETEPSLTRRPR